jgi:hypothetical protein
MFRLHDTTRRRICLAAFFALCLAPTACVLGWGVARSLPGHRRGEAERLGQLLGLEVMLDGVRHPRPGTVLYEGVELRDPETGLTILRSRLVEAVWTRTAASDGQQKSALILFASQPEIETSQVGCLWQLWQRLVVAAPGGQTPELRLTAGELAINGPRPRTLYDVDAGLGAVPAGVQAEVAFRLADTKTGEPARIRIVRNRQVAPPLTSFEIDTGGGEVPCCLFSEVASGLRVLGGASRFTGYVVANQSSSAEWEGEVKGKLLDIDFESMVSEHFPHKLSGLAEVAIDRACFRGGRLEEASGTLHAGPGVIGRTLVEAATEHLALPCRPPKADLPDLISYGQIAARFTLNAKGLVIHGDCEKTARGTVLLAEGQPVLSGMENPVPVVGLIRTLVPAKEVHVPAARQTDWLARHLPVPDLPNPPGSHPSLPHAWSKGEQR